MHFTDLIESDYKSKHAYQLCVKFCLRAGLLIIWGNAGPHSGGKAAWAWRWTLETF